MQAIDYFKNKNNSREDKFNAYYQIDTVTRKSFLKKSISGKGNKAAFDELFNTVGFKLFRDLDYNDKAKWYAYLMTDKKNVSNVIESIINNEDSNTQRQLMHYFNKTYAVQKNIVDVFKKELNSSIESQNKVKYIDNGTYFVNTQEKDRLDTTPPQGWKLHIGSDNIVDYYRMYKIVDKNIQMGRLKNKIKFVNPDKFIQSKEASSNRYGADLTIYLDNFDNLQYIDERLKSYLTESISRKKESDRSESFNHRITFRYGQFETSEDFKNFIYNYNARLVQDNRTDYRPNFVPKASLKQVLNVANVRRKKLELTQDFKQYAIESMLGTISSTPFNNFHVFTFDKSKINRVKGFLETIKSDFNETMPTCIMNMANVGVLIVPNGCEKDLYQEINKLKDIVFFEENHPSTLELNRNKTLNDIIAAERKNCQYQINNQRINNTEYTR